MERRIKAELLSWKDRENRKPLIVRGARQVGKTYVIKNFGNQNFTSFVSVNFEENTLAHKPFGETLTPSKIIRDLSSWLEQPIIPGKTLLFLDEIQACPNALLSLCFFKEQMPELHLIAAGSLLEFALKEERFSFPVGRVEYLYVRPLSLMEFLEAKQDLSTLSWINEAQVQEPIGSATHLKLLDVVKEYFIVGGMPEAISYFLQTKQFYGLDPIHKHLLYSYENDLGKYPKTSQQKFMKRLFAAAPRLICEHFKYAKIDAHAQSRDYQESLDVLSEIGIIHQVFANSCSEVPLELHKLEKKFKLLFLDIGLLPHTTKSLIEEHWRCSTYRGDLAEQFVGQELVAYEKPYAKPSLFYWEREKMGSSAEVDYVIEVEGMIIPIEVKSGSTGKLRSLKQFLAEKKVPLGVQISEAPLALHSNILSVPFYMVQQIPRLVIEYFAQVK